jgi:hypothetical protein
MEVEFRRAVIEREINECQADMEENRRAEINLIEQSAVKQLEKYTSSTISPFE